MAPSNAPKTAPEVKRLRTPDTLLILGGVLLATAVVVAWIPPGVFNEVTRVGGADSREVQIALDSYAQSGPATAVALFAEGGGLGLLNVLFEGLVAGDKFGSAIGLIAFLLVLGGSFGVLMRTQAIDRALYSFIERYQGQAWILIPGLFVLFSLSGAVFGMGEETIPFVLLLVPIFARLGFDAITVVIVTYMATQVGFATSSMNPFSVVVAQGVAGLPPLSGAPLRVAMWATLTLVGALMALRCALRSRAQVDSSASASTAGEPLRASAIDGLILGLLGATLVWVIWGVTARGYYLPELAAQFFAMGLAAGLVAWLSGRADANALAAAFQSGAAQMLPVVLVVALAKGMLLLLGGTDPSTPSVLNTILHALGRSLDGMAPALAGALMLAVQSVINFFVPSGSGQAALTMPVMAPLGDVLGVNRQVSVLAFQLGDGLTNLIIPTSALLMGVLGAARVDFVVWLSRIWPFALAYYALGLAYIWLATAIGYR